MALLNSTNHKYSHSNTISLVIYSMADTSRKIIFFLSSVLVSAKIEKKR